MSAGLLLSACSFDDTLNKLEYEEAPGELKLISNLGGMTVTRGTFDPQATKLNTASSPAVFVTNDGSTTDYITGSDYSNIKLTATDGTGNASNLAIKSGETPTAFYFPQNKGDLTVFLYAPFQTDATIASTTITVSEDQYNTEGYLASDFVFGNATATYSGTDPKTAKITLYHALTSICLKFSDVKGNKVSGLTEVTLGKSGSEIKKKAAIKLNATLTDNNSVATSGVVTTNTSEGTGVVTLLKTGETGADAWTDGTSEYVYGIIPPQDAADIDLVVKIGTSEYTAKLSSSALAMSPATQYTFNVTLGQAELKIESVQITDWTKPAASNTTVE